MHSINGQTVKTAYTANMVEPNVFRIHYLVFYMHGPDATVKCEFMSSNGRFCSKTGSVNSYKFITVHVLLCIEITMVYLDCVEEYFKKKTKLNLFLEKKTTKHVKYTLYRILLLQVL